MIPPTTSTCSHSFFEIVFNLVPMFPIKKTKTMHMMVIYVQPSATKEGWKQDKR